jgi:hypothetical protein
MVDRHGYGPTVVPRLRQNNLTAKGGTKGSGRALRVCFRICGLCGNVWY